MAAEIAVVAAAVAAVAGAATKQGAALLIPQWRSSPPGWMGETPVLHTPGPIEAPSAGCKLIQRAHSSDG